MKKLILTTIIAAATAAQAADKLTLMLDWYINPDHAAIIVAQQKGYFKANDIDLTIEEPSDPSVAPKLVAAGKADLAVDYQPQLYLHHEAGLSVSRISTLISTPLNCIITKKDSDIRTIADLKGKKIGYSVPGVDEAMLKPVLATGGLTLNDVKLINVNFSLSPSVMSGQVDAAIGAFRNVELHEMEKEGIPGKCFYLEEHGIPAYDELIVIAANDHRTDDKFRRFNHALEQASQYILNHPEEAWKDYTSYKKDLGGKDNHASWNATLPRIALRPAALDTERYRRYGEFLKQQELIKTAPKVENIAVQP